MGRMLMKWAVKITFIFMLSFILLLESTASNLDIVEAKTTSTNDLDRITINKMLTEIALEYNVPPEIVKAVAEQESQWKQFKSNGEPLISPDGGIGIMQVTNQPDYDQERLKTDIAYNIRAGVEILSKNFSRTDLPSINGMDRNILEHWYFAIMAYNGIKPKNSPVVQSTGKRNQDAYQEKVYDYIENFSLTDIQRLPFTSSDFSYNSNSSETIKFVTKAYQFDLPFTKTKYTLKKGQKVITTDEVYLRQAPTTDSNATKLKKGVMVTISGPFAYEQNPTKINHFVWYPVQTSDGKKGYIASSYLTYAFKDVPAGHYALDSISYLYESSILNGVGNDNFGFGQKITRLQAALLLTRTNNITLENRPDPSFLDVSKTHPYYKEIAAAVDEGYFQGLPGSKFDPNGTFTRGMMAEVLQRIYHFPPATGTLPFKDVPKNAYYADEVARLYAAGITTGISKTEFGPNNTITREDFAVFLVRTLNWKNGR